jgi:DNA-binding FadR family transcriptional regulator
VALTDEAIEKIKVMILFGELCVGDRPPREADLAWCQQAPLPGQIKVT